MERFRGDRPRGRQSLKDRAGQFLLVGLPGTRLDRETRRLLREVRPGGVALSGNNVESAEQVALLTAQVRDAVGHEIIIAVAQEGGPVDYFRDICEPLPSAEAISKAGGADLAEQFGKLTARQLRLLGINMNLAPVLDLSGDNYDNGLRGRTFGASPYTVTNLAGAYLDGLQRGHVIGCGKHFPGIGGSEVDSRRKLAVVTHTWQEIFERDLIPFRDLMFHRPGERLRSVMVSHAAYPDVSEFLQQMFRQKGDPPPLPGLHEFPASISGNITTGLLRQTLNFDGLVITDDIEAEPVARLLPAAEAALRAIEAGSDMVMLGGQTADILEVRDHIAEALSSHRLGAVSLDRSMAGVARALAIADGPEPFDSEDFYQVSRDIAALKRAHGLGVDEAEHFAPPFKPDREDVTPVTTEAPSTERTYRMALSVEPAEVAVGQTVQLRVSMVMARPGPDAFELAAEAGNFYCFVSANDKGLLIDGAEWATIQFDPETGFPAPVNFRLQAYLRGKRAYSVQLFNEDSAATPTRVIEAGGVVVVNPPRESELGRPILPALEVRVTRQPDFILQVETSLPEGEDGRRELTFYLTSRLPALQVKRRHVGGTTFRAAEIPRLRALLASTLQSASDLQPEDARERMLSFGTYLFDRLFPADGAAAFREAFRQAADQLSTWLVVEDGITWLPWELVAPYDDNTLPRFLGERFRMGRWVAGLGPAPYGEVPLGETALTHYKGLKPGGKDEELRAWQRLLQARAMSNGVREVVKPETPFYRLHLLRYEEQEGTPRDIVAHGGVAAPLYPTEDTERARLDLRLKRPVVTLSILGGDDAGREFSEGWTLPERVLPFLRAGAGAVAGPWWSTDEDADRVFWSTFYDLLERRVPLGDAVRRGRLAVERALPHRPDWLAYTLFGDPHARAYEPEPSEGYTTLQRLGPDDPLRPGQTFFVRASISSLPSEIYEDRLVRAEQLPQEPMALFIAPGLQKRIPDPVPMIRRGRSVVATYQLEAPEAGEFMIIARLFDGEERLQTLQLPIVVENPE